MEERSVGILLRPPGETPAKLSWADTTREVAAAREDWSDWDVTDAEGLDAVPWARAVSQRAGEPTADPRAARRSRER